jgi:penicillin-binding protein 1A
MDEDRRRLAVRTGLVLAVVAGLAGLLALLVLPAVLVTETAVDTVEDEFLDHPPLPEEIPPAPRNSVIYAADGEAIAEVFGEVRRVPADLEQIPEHTRQAVIATEDRDFWQHDGVDHDAMGRALLRNLEAGEALEGASTITQQYVTMAFLDPEPTVERKAQEIVWAVELEERLSKEEILERYLNRIYLGNGNQGVATAAEFYFSKPVSELDLVESALLAGMIRAPELNDPLEDPDRASTRRDIVLEQMVDAGVITREEADEVIGTEIELEIHESEETEPFWVDLVKRFIYDEAVQLQPGLREALGETRKERIDALFDDGLFISTTLDTGMRELAEATVASYTNDPINDPLGGLITVDHSTGAVRAFALGPKEHGPCPDEEEPCPTTTVNPAFPGIGGSGRQSGSAFKPFVSAAALQQGMGTGTSYDSPSGEPIAGCGDPVDPYAPHNFGQQDAGTVTMTEAMRDSVNVYFAKLARDAGVRAVAESAHDHGLVFSPNLQDFDGRMCAIALGTALVFPVEMAIGFGVWANDGTRCAPYIVEEVADRDGEVLYTHEPQCEEVVDPGVAATMRQLLRGPVSGDGTAGVVGAQVGGDVFGKTGTTDDFVDAWFVGAARGHTTAAWIGYETPAPMRNVNIGGRAYGEVTGGELPAPMWADFVSQLPTG